MTSPIIEVIDNITESNIYNGYNITVDKAIDLMEGTIPKGLIYAFMNKSGANKVSNKLEELQKAFVEDKLDSFKIENLRGNDIYSFIDLISWLQQVRKSMPEMNEDITADLRDFRKVLEGADEYSNFGRLLSINQGIGTSDEDLKKQLNLIKKIIKEREKALGLEGLTDEQIVEKGYDPEMVGKFDVKRWLRDDDYKEQIKKYYSTIKVVVPIFDVISTISQYNSAFQLVDAVNEINNQVSLINKVTEIIYDGRKDNPNDWSDHFKKNLQHAIFSKFIQNFFYKSGLKFPYLGKHIVGDKVEENAKLIDKNFEEIPAEQDSFINFDSLQQLASFKNIFENYIIPKLKEGKYITVDDSGNIVEVIDDSLKENKFIQGLMTGTDGDMQLQRLNVDLMNYEQTPEGLSKVNSYILGLQELQKIDINGIPLSDWFILYNLYTNHNNYGSNRLTTLFDSFINNNGKSSLIQSYYKYIGDLCWYADTEKLGKGLIQVTDKSGYSFVLDENDLFMMSAVLTSSSYGKKDPIIRVTTPTGSVYQKRKDNYYINVDNKFFKAENTDKDLERQNNIDNYATVGGLSQEEKIQLMKQLRELSFNTILALNKLKQDGFLEENIIC